MKLVTREEMRELDRRTIEEIGILGLVLMENAGRGTAQIIKKRFGPERKKVAILCGRGNNGGDGFVVARYLKNWGWKVKVYLLSEKEKITGDAKANLEVWLKMGGELKEIRNEEELWSIKEELQHFDLIVDALLGTGLKDEVKGILKEAIQLINALGKPVIAIDIPSGIDATTGKVLGVAVKATLTVTFGLPKIGELIHPGLEYTGELYVVDISIPQVLVEDMDLKHTLLEPLELDLSPLKPRPLDTHKLTYGHLLVIAGSVGKTGAAAMAAEAALKMGTGLVTLGVPKSLNPILEVKLTEVMTYPLSDKEGVFSEEALEEVSELLAGKTALAIGPGIGTERGSKRLTLELLKLSQLPMVIDADGLNCLVGELEILKARKAPTVLTPHPGEMAKLIGISSKEVQSQRIQHAREFAERYGVILVLKGSRTLIAEPGGRVFVNPTGNPGMASGGTGDILTGMIGGLLAQGMDPLEAAKLGVYLHGLSGDLAKEEVGEVCLVATDLLRYLPQAIKEVLKGDVAHIKREP
jgi:NAD(P)H-hydrate epimerase